MHTVFVNCLVKQFAMCVGVVAILMLNVMDVFSVCGGALLDRPCMVFQRVIIFFFYGFMGITTLSITIRCYGTSPSLEITFAFFTRQQSVFLTIR